MIPTSEQLREIARKPEGRFPEVPFAALLMALAVEQRTLALEVRRKQLSKRIVLELGIPVDCRSNLVNETLGHFMVSQGRLRAEDLNSYLGESASRGLRLGEVLLDHGVIAAEELWKLLQQNLAKKLLDVFAWRDGEYRLLPDTPPAESSLKIRVPQLIVTGITKCTPQEEVDAAVVPLVGKMLCLHPDPPIPLEEIRLSARQSRVAVALRSGWRIDELAVGTGLPFEEINRLLYALAVLGVVVTADSQAGRAALTAASWGAAALSRSSPPAADAGAPAGAGPAASGAEGAGSFVPAQPSFARRGGAETSGSQPQDASRPASGRPQDPAGTAPAAPAAPTAGALADGPSAPVPAGRPPAPPAPPPPEPAPTSAPAAAAAPAAATPPLQAQPAPPAAGSSPFPVGRAAPAAPPLAAHAATDSGEGAGAAAHDVEPDAALGPVPAPEERRNQIILAYMSYRRQDAFDLLGATEDDTLPLIQQRYLSFASRYAPWTFAGPGLEEVEEKARDLFLAGARAYGELADPQQRGTLLLRRKTLSEERQRRTTSGKLRIKTDLLDSEAQYRKGKALMESGKLHEAAQLLEFASDCDPQNGLYSAELAYCRFLFAPAPATGVRALKELQETLRHDPDCGLAIFYSGEIHRQLGNFAEAEGHLRRAIKIMSPDRRPIEALKALATQKKH
ncbi:MAG TPA: DUF4388 domain-containing protein [Thermoanaerobaculia bacterium]|nr:DUF4388 domain-containing protein [Thermoanaerobaculia bacterium]